MISHVDGNPAPSTVDLLGPLLRGPVGSSVRFVAFFLLSFSRFDLKFTSAFKLFAPNLRCLSTSNELRSVFDITSTNLKDSVGIPLL